MLGSSRATHFMILRMMASARSMKSALDGGAAEAAMSLSEVRPNWVGRLPMPVFPSELGSTFVALSGLKLAAVIALGGGIFEVGCRGKRTFQNCHQKR